MSLVAAEINLDDLDRSIRGLLRQAGNLGPAWKQAKKPILADQREHARAQEGPDGQWPARSPFTIARMRSRGKRRRPMGLLPRALKITMAPRSFRAESRVRWSMAHVTGATVGHGVTLPARPFLWASRQLLETVAVIIAKQLGLRWPRG